MWVVITHLGHSNFDTTLPMVFQTLENVDLRYFVDVNNLWELIIQAQWINQKHY